MFNVESLARESTPDFHYAEYEGRNIPLHLNGSNCSRAESLPESRDDFSYDLQAAGSVGLMFQGVSWRYELARSRRNTELPSVQ